MCGGYTGEHDDIVSESDTTNISVFTRVDISIINSRGELSEPLEVRLGELDKYITMAERAGKAVLMTAEPGIEQTDILEFLGKTENL